MKCRLCRNDDGPGADELGVRAAPLIKYGARHYAHFKCLVMKRAGLAPSAELVRLAVLDKLTITELAAVRPIADCDNDSTTKTFAAIGITTREFMDYYRERQQAGR